KDRSLGIGGATLLEPEGADWKPVVAPRFHTHGAAKMYSTACFQAIGGLTADVGWDTADEVGAMARGFKSVRFAHIQAYHHRPQGGAMRWRKAALGKGKAAYVVGYHPLFMMTRAARRAFSWPPMLFASFMLF